jgi:DNA polymerase-3 subunit epsilon
MKIAGIDIETTGLDVDADHKIIEIAVLTYDWHSRTLEDAYVQRVDPDRSIQAAAQAVHGIAYDELVGQPKWPDVAGTVHAKLAAIKLGVIHNAGFDIPFIGTELTRAGMTLPSMQVFCTMESARWACADGKYPKLGELCFALGVPYDPSKAHGADYDVRVMMECFFRGFDRGFYKPEHLDLMLASTDTPLTEPVLA